MRILLISFLVIFFAFNGKAQDISFSQYINTLIYTNPSFAGSTGNRFVYTARIEERTFPTNLPSFNFAYDHLIRSRNVSGTFNDTRSSFGISGILDNQGFFTSPSGRKTLISFYSFSLSYAYRIDLEEGAIQLGLKGAYLFREFGNFNLSYPNQFNGVGFNSNGGENFSNNLVGAPDFSVGGVLSMPSYWVSYSASHVNRPAIGFLNTNIAKLPIRHTIAAGYKWQFTRRYKNEDNPRIYIKPSFIFHLQSSSRQIIIGNNFIYLPISVGVWYRGSNFLTSIENLGQDAIVFLAGLRFPIGSGLFSVHYSYDFPLPRRTSLNSNAISHEITLSYEFRRIESNICPSPWR